MVWQGHGTPGPYISAAGGGPLIKHPRVTFAPEKMGGVPSIRDLRIPVETVFQMLAEGMSMKEILKAYPDLEPEDIDAALAYAMDTGGGR